MNTIIAAVDSGITEEEPNQDLELASEILKKGGLVAFPTETVYGLGGDALNPDASRKIYSAKGRPSDNPLIVHIADETDLQKIAKDIPEAAYKLMDVFWPGPMTMIFHKKPIVPDSTTGGLDTVAVRMPSHNVAYELIRRSGVMIAAPSANTSGRPSPTMASHVREDMEGKIDMIIDGGDCRYGIESTIIDMTGEVPTILRPGYITREMLEDVIGTVEVDPAILGEAAHVRPKAPGMKYTHYAPKGIMYIVEGESSNSVIRCINRMVKERQMAGCKVGVLATRYNAMAYEADEVIVIGDKKDELMISSNLYRTLREFDARGVDYIYSESFAGSSLGTAIMNRLIKAAGHRVIQAPSV
ncbi:MAG: threonylcarbamoyl-AMP synthase [Lachnospiraceae bacterium]|nr:threonylcarbamoyl-AMP synthase [Lachnospiraceae bacterium]MBP3505857.1 threonylcarbamoyl-AMP synthase [Lachnospiraceae bacterium]